MIPAIWTPSLGSNLREIKILYDVDAEGFKIKISGFREGEINLFLALLRIFAQLGNDSEFMNFMAERIYKEYEKNLRNKRK